MDDQNLEQLTNSFEIFAKSLDEKISNDAEIKLSKIDEAELKKYGPDIVENSRKVELLLFINPDGLSLSDIKAYLPDIENIEIILEYLLKFYHNRGINLRLSGDIYQFVTASDLSEILNIEMKVKKKLSNVAMEILAIIAYHQPCTRPEIESIRGISLSPGTIDKLLEVGWVKTMGRRKKAPGKPLLFGTSEKFLQHFGLSSIDDLPSIDELKKIGLLNVNFDDSMSLFGNEGEEDQQSNEETKFQEDFLSNE